MDPLTPRPGWAAHLDERIGEAPLSALTPEEQAHLRECVHRALDRLGAPDAPEPAWRVARGWATPRFSGHGLPLFIGDLLPSSDASALACMARVLLDEHPTWGDSPVSRVAAHELQLAVAVALYSGTVSAAALAPLRARLDLLRRHFLDA